MKLTEKHCVPCEGMGEALNREQIAGIINNIPGWTLAADAKSVSRSIKVKNFMSAVTLIQNIAAIAEMENHHPDLHLTGYRNVKIDLSTHALNGVTENDFILAAKINELPMEIIP